MIRSFSLHVQQIIAAGLLVFVLLCLLLFVILPWREDLGDDLDNLARSRQEIARLTQIRAAPIAPTLPGPAPQSIITAPNGQAANRILAGLVTLAASRSNIVVTPAPVMTGTGLPPMLLTLPFTARGEQSAMLSFLNSLESGAVVLRFRQIAIRNVPPPVILPLPDARAAASSSIMPQSPNAAPGSSPALLSPAPLSLAAPSTEGANNIVPAQPPVPVDAGGQVEVEAVIEGLWGRSR